MQLQISWLPRMLLIPPVCEFLPPNPIRDAVISRRYSFTGRRAHLLLVRAMESEAYRYVPVDLSHEEGQFADSKVSGRSGGYGGMSRFDGLPASDEGDFLMDIFYLEQFGHVALTVSESHLSWQSVEDDKKDAIALLCCGTTHEDTEGKLPLAEVIAVISSGFGPVRQAKASVYGSLPPKLLHRVEVHTFLRSGSKWVPKMYVFGHNNGTVVQRLTQRIQLLLDADSHRPKTLLVFVNPYGGKGSGVQTWERVEWLFELAKIKVEVVKTERAGHARDMMERATEDELKALDGVVVVGGDGFFNEVLNGLVTNRHKARAAAVPQRWNSYYKKRTLRQQRDSEVNLMFNNKGGLRPLLGDSSTSLGRYSDQHPLLQNVDSPLNSEAAVSQEGKNAGTGRQTSSNRFESEGPETAVRDAMAHVKEGELMREQTDSDPLGYVSVSLSVPVQNEQGRFLQRTADPIIGSKRKGDDSASSGSNLSSTEFEHPNPSPSNLNAKLRIGIIPAGSTDTVVISTTGTRDPLTSALHIILGDSMPLDIVRITGWKKPSQVSRNEKPEVRYAASFAGYGFYGDVMKESEVLRWMGPVRYDFSGFLVFLKHKTYEAEISFLDIPQDQSDPQELSPQGFWAIESFFNSTRGHKKEIVCLANCAVCAAGFDFSRVLNCESDSEGSYQAVGMPAHTWKTRHAKFHSIGAAVMSCRNEKAPEGVAAHAHLADGLLHLILIRECSRSNYLRQLLRLTRRGVDPLDFSFVEHYKTPLFTFKSHGDNESVWNVDGELLMASQITGQVFRGLITLFARGPEI